MNKYIVGQLVGTGTERAAKLDRLLTTRLLTGEKRRRLHADNSHWTGERQMSTTTDKVDVASRQ